MATPGPPPPLSPRPLPRSPSNANLGASSSFNNGSPSFPVPEVLLSPPPPPPAEPPLLSNAQIRRLAQEREEYRVKSEQLRDSLTNSTSAAMSLEAVISELDSQLKNAHSESQARRLAAEPSSASHASSAELAAVKTERDGLLAQIAHANNQNRQHDLNTAMLKNNLLNLENQLKMTREELGASRAFVTDETSADGSELLRRLADLNEAVDDLAFRFVQAPQLEELLSRPFTREAEIALLRGAGQRAPMFYPIAAHCLATRATMAHFMQTMTQHLMCNFIERQVFDPFIPGLSNAEDEPTNGLYNLILSNEPQNRAARWRSITYAHAHPRRNDMSLVSMCGEEFRKVIMDMLRNIAPGSPTQFLQNFINSIETIVLDAIKWQDQAKINHLGYDYKPFVPWNTAFNPNRMTMDEESVAGEGHVIACVGIGVEAVTNVISNGGRIEKATTVPLKAKVLCGRSPDWNDFSKTFAEQMMPDLSNGSAGFTPMTSPILNTAVPVPESESPPSFPIPMPHRQQTLMPIIIPPEDTPPTSPIPRSPSSADPARRKVWGLTNEFLDTEKNYFGKVRMLYESYAYPLYVAGHLPESCSTLVLNIKAIMDASGNLVKALKAQGMDTQDAPFWVGIALFDNVLSLPAIVIAYIEYIGHHERTAKLFTAASKAMPRSGPTSYAEFEKRSRKFIDPKNAIRDLLPSLMMEPVQRLPRYRLLLLELIKFPQVISESDRQALVMANERLDRILKAAELAGLIVSGGASAAAQQQSSGGLGAGLTGAVRRSVLVSSPRNSRIVE